SSPTRIVQATCEFFDEVMKEKVDIVDPTNPFMLLLETSAAHAALATNESLLNLRRTYIGLAQTDDDIYRHMTDTEYLGRFSTPGTAMFTFIIEYSTLRNAMMDPNVKDEFDNIGTWDPVENCFKAIIPRDTVHVVDN